MGTEGPITEGSGDEPDILLTLINQTLSIAWLVIHELATAAVAKSRRWLPRHHDPVEMPQSICGEIFDHIEQQPPAANVPSAIGVLVVVDAKTAPNRHPRAKVRRIGEMISDAAKRAIVEGHTQEEFRRDLSSNGPLKAEVERLADELMKAVQDKDRGWTRNDKGRKVRRPAGRNLTIVDLAGLWTYQDPDDEAIRAEQSIALAEAIGKLDPPVKAIFTLRYFEGRMPRDIAARVGMTPRRVSDLLAAARSALAQQLQGP